SEVSASVTEEEIERPLERVVAAMDLERCGLFLVRPGQSHATISHVAQARGARSLDIGFGGEILPRLSNALSEGRAVELDESGALKAGAADAEPPQVVLVPVSREGDAISGIFFQAGGGHATLPADMTSRMLLLGQILLSAVNRRGAEDLLRSSEEKYRTVVGSQSDLICPHLPDPTLTFVHEAYCRYFGLSRNELVGRRFLDLLPERSRGQARQHVQSLVESPRA